MTNNYRRLHKMPMVHTKRYPHQSRFEKAYGFTIPDMLESLRHSVDAAVKVIGEMAQTIADWAKGLTYVKD